MQPGKHTLSLACLFACCFASAWAVKISSTPTDAARHLAFVFQGIHPAARMPSPPIPSACRAQRGGWQRSTVQMSAQARDSYDNLRDVFERFDKDNSGSLEKTELPEALNELGLHYRCDSDLCDPASCTHLRTYPNHHRRKKERERRGLRGLPLKIHSSVRGSFRLPSPRWTAMVMAR